jgi:hypothetical protein
MLPLPEPTEVPMEYVTGHSAVVKAWSEPEAEPALLLAVIR